MDEPRRLGSFELIRPLGKGGMGEVWEARDVRLGRRVAIKRLPRELARDPFRRELFAQEARAAASINHPNVATLYELAEVEVEDGSRDMLLVFELAEGERLSAHGKRWSEAELTSVGLQLARGLAAAHARGIVHRDLKLSNVVIDDAGTCRILDFGIAQLLSAAGSEDAPTVESGSEEDSDAARAGKIVGSVPYMSPEQAAGKPIDARSDLFSLGVCLYELATGETPYPRGSWSRYLLALRTPAPKLRVKRPDLSPELEALIAKLLAHQPEERYSSASEAAAALARLVTPAEGASRRSLVLQLSVAAGVLVAALLGGWYLSGGAARAAGDRLAVLRFENLGNRPEDEYFCRGLSSVLIGELSGLPELEVVSALHTEGMVANEETLERLAKKYRVAEVISGEVQRVGDRLQLQVFAVAPRGGETLWAHRLEHPAGDLLGMQRELARAVAEHLSSRLRPASRDRLRTFVGSSSRAFELVLRGRELLESSGAGGASVFVSAAAAFRRAVEEDPDLALAWSGLARALIEVYLAQRDLGLADEAEAAAQHALALEPDLIEAEVALAKILRLTGRSAEALARLTASASVFASRGELETEMILGYAAEGRTALSEQRLEQALERRAGGDVYHELALEYEDLGEAGQADSYYRQAIAADPLDWRYRNDYGTFLMARDADAARRELEEAVRLEPRSPKPLANLLAAYVQWGEPAAGLAAAREVLGELGSDTAGTSPLASSAELASNYGTALFFTGEFEQALRHYETASRISPNSSLIAGNLGDAYAALGQTDAARAAYRRALELVEQELLALPRVPEIRVQRVLFLAKVGSCPEAVREGRAVREQVRGRVQELFALASAFGVCDAHEPGMEVITELLEHVSLDSLRQNPELESLLGSAEPGAHGDGSR